MHSFLQDPATREKCHILKMLEVHGQVPHRSFHTPGHKVNGYDITELAYSDNLSCPQGVLLAAQQDIAEILGADVSFLLTDGSTSGVLSMLYALKESGVRSVAAPVLSHKSFFNGCALLGLTPKLFETPETALPCPLQAQDVRQALCEADALFLTSPDYYGNVADLQAIASLCRAQKKPLVIDGAHGGHLHGNSKLYAGAYADMWVDGVHKSLPALTQGAVVSAKKTFAKLLQKAVDIFRTTSPSYPIMASVEYAVKYPLDGTLQGAVEELKKSEDCFYLSGDWTKLCLFVKDGFTAEKILHTMGVYPEFSQENAVCFYLSPVQSEADFKAVLACVERLKKEGLVCSEKEAQRVHAPLLLQDFDENSIEEIPLSEADGRVSAAVCGLFPPCLPLLRKGEVITAEKRLALQSASNRFGVENDRIKVVAKCKESL
jgi:lysine decarboxylase